jgi:membrane fusion protein (multidrug efflux system)
MKSYIKTVIISGLLITSSLYGAEAPKAGATLPKVDVYVVPKAKNIPVELEYPARVTSVKNVTIVARVSGILEKKYFTEGATVHKGDLLYKIEPNIYAADVQSAKATLELEKSKFDKAQKDWTRAKGLYEDKAISEQDKDTAYFAYTSAQASVDVAKANLDKAMVSLNYTDVKATINGVTGMKMIDEGDFVKEGTSLTTITQTNPIYAEFSIPDINTIKQKYTLENGNWSNMQAAKLKASLIVDGQKYKEMGNVDFVDAQVDQATSTLKVRAIFKNNATKLLAGQYVKVKLIGIISKNVLSVPQKAVLQNPLGTIVFVVVNGKVSVKPVKILNTVGQNFIVSGVASKDVVVVNNFFRIKPGASVAIDKTINKQED